MEDKIWVVDDTPSRRYPIYTRGNIGEVFPVVVSPLTWPLYGSQAELGWRDAFRDFGVYLDSDFGTDPMGILGCFGGYGYLNASFIRVFAVRTPGLTVDDIDRLFFGEVESAAPSFAMWDLSRLPEGSTQFDDAFVTFLDKFGCRGPNEWEGSSETWETKPQLALAAIACMRNATDDSSPRNQQHRLAA